MFKDPVLGYFLWPSENIPGGVGSTRYFSEFGNLYYAKILWQEMFWTFIFVYAYLLISYKPQLRFVDDIIKGFGIAAILFLCYKMCAEAGAGLNPAFAIAQTCYQVGFLNDDGFNGNRFASAIWCYIVFPLIGGIVAALFFKMHIAMDHRASVQEGKDNNNAVVAEKPSS
jgi:glycerol uptake facilitator-like aquaporin